MKYTVFNQNKFDHTKQSMFFGEPVNVARYDIQKYPTFERLIERQLSFFWRPEEIDLSRDKLDWQSLPNHEQHIFISNLKYQTLLDSVQGRSPNVVLLPLVSLPELETWIETWAFYETIHSRSYTHIIRNIFNDPSVVFDDIIDNPEILKRATEVSKYYDRLHKLSLSYQKGDILPNQMYEIKQSLYLCLIAIYALEAIRFYVSFACSFAFAERKLMEGNAKVIKLIARDEALHMTAMVYILNHLIDDDSEFEQIIKDSENQVYQLFTDVAEQEKQWVSYLFKDGSMLGLNQHILNQYVDYITNLRIQAIGFSPIYAQKSNPIPWINPWLASDNVQVAPQETEIVSYLVGQIDSNLADSDFKEFEL